MVYVSYFTEDAAEHRERNKSKQTWFLLVFVCAMLPLQSVLGVTFLNLRHFNIDCFTLHVLCQRVCVQLPTSADNVALLVFAAERQTCRCRSISHGR